MKLFYSTIFLIFFSVNSYAQEFSCIDKKHGRLSKMILENELIKYEDEKGKPAEYKIVDNSDKMIMAISKGTKENDPMLNYIFIIKNQSLAYNAILRSIKDSYNEIYTNNIVLKCIGKVD
jgi:hypothetical protein